MVRKTFRVGETRPKGSVFWLPRELGLADDPKHSRPHLLLHDCEGEAEDDLDDASGIFSTLAYMTTKDTEHEQYGAPRYRLSTLALRPVDVGQAGSFVLTSRFLMTDVTDLHEAAAQVNVADMRGCLTEVRDGIGIGTGNGVKAFSSSVRGCLARIESTVRELTGLEFGIVITCHEYSGARRYQALVPVLDVADLLDEGETSSDFVPESAEFLVERARAGWTSALPAHWAGILVDTARLITLTEEWRKVKNPRLWLARQITVLPIPVEDHVLHAIDERIVTRLSLPAPAQS